MTGTGHVTLSHATSRDGTQIGYWSSGQGPPLLLVHGVLGDHSRWDALRPHLEPTFTVHAMDRRGRGASGDAPKYAAEREFEDVTAVVAAAAEEAGAPVAVYGHSGGASFALGAAALTPNVGRLVLYEPAVNTLDLLPPGLLERLDGLLAVDEPEAVVETFCREVLHMTDEQLDAYRQQPSWPARIAAAHTLPRELRIPPERLFDADRAATATAPTLLLEGSETPHGFKAAIRDVAAALPDARIATLDGHGHTADVLAPELVTTELLAFLREPNRPPCPHPERRPATSQTIDVQAFVAFEADGYNRVGDVYHRLNGPITEQTVAPLLDAAAVGPGMRVLDVATGPGYAAGQAAARGADALGVDVAADLLALARELWPDAAFRTADAHDLPFDDDRFDAVVANFLIPHLADHAQAVGEAVRVLAPGGRLALSTWDHAEQVGLLWPVVGAVRSVGAQPSSDIPAGPDFFRFSDEATFTALLREAGLTDVTVDTLAYIHQVPSAADLWHGIVDGSVRTAALVRAQPPAVQEQIRAAFDDITERYRTDDGLELPISVKIAAGRKTPQHT